MRNKIRMPIFVFLVDFCIGKTYIIIKSYKLTRNWEADGHESG
ncbi:hypothetical protein X953_00475 [Virgibacillus sp. SK37]|nr:hypothetical protein X953_00475 [Virgibacillus sp. SK37]